jgi:hypothetical protein
MKSMTKILLVSAIAVTAIAISAAPSEAAKKKRMAAQASCHPAYLSSSDCTGGLCKVNICGGDGKWYWAMFTPWCVSPVCPAAN